MSNLRIVLANGHPALRDRLQDVASAETGSDGPSAWERVVALDPDVVVVDVSMPGESSGGVADSLERAGSNRTVLVLNVSDDRASLRKLLESGTTHSAEHFPAASELLRAIRSLAAAGNGLDRSGDAPSESGIKLSERESVVLRDIAQGYSNKEIAARLGVSVKTVETYKTRSQEKLGLRSRVDIVRYAKRCGWLGEV